MYSKVVYANLLMLNYCLTITCQDQNVLNISYLTAVPWCASLRPCLRDFEEISASKAICGQSNNNPLFNNHFSKNCESHLDKKNCESQ